MRNTPFYMQKMPAFLDSKYSITPIERATLLIRGTDNKPEPTPSKTERQNHRTGSSLASSPHKTLSFSHYEEESRALASHPSSPHRLQPAASANA
jgi:hypothetical protein